MRFQERDGEIISAIYENQGILAKRQLKEIFWPDKSWRAMEKRLSKLFKAGYLAWPNSVEFKENPIPEPFCWLDWKGVLFISGKLGVNITPPKGTNENQLRELKHDLYNHRIFWVREPRWIMLKHDFAVTDFRLAVLKEINAFPQFTVENWKSESEFRSDPDIVEFEIKDRNGFRKQLKKRVLPDAYFEIVDEERRARGELHRIRFLIELDMSTHDNPSFGREKIAPGVAYIKSQAFKARFGHNNGLWLVITNGGPRRIRNLMLQVHEIAEHDEHLFFFVSIADLKEGNPMTSPVWWQSGKEELIPLLIA